MEQRAYRAYYRKRASGILLEVSVKFAAKLCNRRKLQRKASLTVNPKP